MKDKVNYKIKCKCKDGKHRTFDVEKHGVGDKARLTVKPLCERKANANGGYDVKVFMPSLQLINEIGEM